MSKAFTKDDAAPEALTEADPADLVPAGSPNYLTAAGLRGFQAELAQLNDQPPGEDRERRRRWLSRLIEISRPIEPTENRGGVVRFGATVRLLAGEDERSYEIVGIQEADATAGRISWISPLAKALLGKSVGDEVVFRRPGGVDELEILGVEFRPRP